MNNQSISNIYKRSAIGQISDIFKINHEDSENIAFVILSTDVVRTRIAEVTAKDGAKTQYMAKYDNFYKVDSVPLNDYTNDARDKNVLVMMDSNMNMKTYPNTLEAVKQVSGRKSAVSMYLANRAKTLFGCFHLSDNITTFIQAWNESFSEKGETLLNFRWPTFTEQRRDSKLHIGEVEFQRYDDSFIVLLTIQSDEKNLKLYVIDTATGRQIAQETIFEMPLRIPFLQVYDNAILLGIHHDISSPHSDKLFLFELVLTSQVADQRDSRMGTSPLDFVIAIKSIIELDEKIYGSKFLFINKKEYIAVVEKNCFKLFAVASISRDAKTSSPQPIKKVALPSDIQFRFPVEIVYESTPNQVLLQGLDMVSFDLT